MVLKNVNYHQKMVPFPEPKLHSMLRHHVQLLSSTLCVNLRDSNHHRVQSALHGILPLPDMGHGLLPAHHNG